MLAAEAAGRTELAQARDHKVAVLVVSVAVAVAGPITHQMEAEIRHEVDQMVLGMVMYKQAEVQLVR
jgi:hypothetical protein